MVLFCICRWYFFGAAFVEIHHRLDDAVVWDITFGSSILFFKCFMIIPFLDFNRISNGSFICMASSCGTKKSIKESKFDRLALFEYFTSNCNNPIFFESSNWPFNLVWLFEIRSYFGFVQNLLWVLRDIWYTEWSEKLCQDQGAVRPIGLTYWFFEYWCNTPDEILKWNI